MKKVKVSELRPGMMYDQAVYIDPGNVLVQARQEIQARDIERLVKWGIREVETNGQLIEGEKKTAAVNLPPLAAPVSRGIPEADQIKISADYEAMRKAKISFRTVIKEAAEVIQNNYVALADNRPFDNHSILNIASNLVEEMQARRYLLLAFQTVKFPPFWSVQHTLHAACYGIHLGMALNYTRPRLQELAFGMLLMDAGMVLLPRHLKEKADKLTDNEVSAIKTHPLRGYQILIKHGKVKANLANIALQHHENFDGSGYPQSIKSGQIEESARIARIADCYTALIEKRPQRAAFLPYDAMKQMLSVQMNQFDPKLLRAMLGQLSIYPVGSLVELSSKKIGIVIGCKADKPLRPLLRLLRDENGLPLGGLAFLDLMHDTDLYIVKALSPGSSAIDLENEV